MEWQRLKLQRTTYLRIEPISEINLKLLGETLPIDIRIQQNQIKERLILCLDISEQRSLRRII